MKRYLIGGLVADIDVNCKKLDELGRSYETDTNKKADITVTLSDKRIHGIVNKHPELSFEDAAYLASGTVFFQKAVNYNALLLHSSCICVNKKAYAFTASSKIGKSTHTALWKKLFKDSVTYINDDKPLIREINGTFYACGTPWCGNTTINNNISVPLGAIVIISRAKENKMTLSNPNLDPTVAVKIIEQTCRIADNVTAPKLLETVDRLLKKTPVYYLNCNMSDEAAILSYNTITGNSAE